MAQRFSVSGASPAPGGGPPQRYGPPQGSSLRQYTTPNFPVS